jgi:hypothetical protein
MLTDRIVVEAEVSGEFGDVDRLACVADVSEDLMASGIAQSSRLFLKGYRHRLPNPRAVGHPSSILLFYPRYSAKKCTSAVEQNPEEQCGDR